MAPAPSIDPCLTIAAAVERAKLGIHGAELPLIPLFHAREPFALQRIALLVFGDLAPTNALGPLDDALRSDDAEARKYASEAAALSGALRLVPSMLHAWNRATHIGDRETIAFAISDLLEPTAGAIASQANIWSAPVPDAKNMSPGMQALLEAQRLQATEDDEEREPDFNDLVTAAHAALSERLSPDAIVFGRSEWNVRELAETFLKEAQTEEGFGFIGLRHRFESSTGIDCRGFFRGGAPQRLVMQATLEEFLQSPAATAYEPGQRYFFGRRITE